MAAVVVAVGLPAIALAAATPFSDVPAGGWDAAAITELSTGHVLTGYPDGTFRPDAPVTRSELIAAVYRLLHDGVDAAAPAAAPYPDVAVGLWFAGDAADAAAHGWFPAVARGSPLHPAEPATREEAVAALVLAAGLPNGTGDLSHYRDATTVAGWAFHPLVTAVDLGILHGFPDFSLRPRQVITRGQLAVLLEGFSHRLLTVDGHVYRVTGSLTMEATSYSDREPGVGTTTYTGTRVHVGEAAVDPSVIPLGTYMWVSGYHTGYLPARGLLEHAEDTGGAIVGHRIDLYMQEPAAATDAFGEQIVHVELLQPVK